jgi:hypothetical protein
MPPSGTGVTGILPVLGRDGKGAGFNGGVYTGGAVADGAGGGCFLCPHAVIPTAAINRIARHAERVALA